MFARSPENVRRTRDMLRLHLPAVRGAIALALAALCGAAHGGDLEVSPVLVELTAERPSAMITVRNESAAPVRFEVRVFAWDQGRDGEMALAATPDLVAYPPLLELAPGEARSVRVGTRLPPGASERSYRVFVEQLAAPEPSDAPARVAVLTRFGIPVFVEPPTRIARAEIVPPELVGRRIEFAVRSGGTVRIRPRSVRVTVGDAAGRALFEKELPAWYVLAGGERAYTVDLDETACAAGQTLSIVARLDSGDVTAVVPLRSIRASRP
jgi:fimbrial chaperone protein